MTVSLSYSSIFIAMLSTIMAISLLRPFAISINLTDAPSDRKTHEGNVPLIGGIAMFIGFLVSIFGSSIDLNSFKYFFLASLIIVAVGIVDDHRDISVGYRLVFQMIAALIVVAVGGVEIESLGNLLAREVILLNSWSMFFTIFAIIAAMNAVNMSDGVNGLAGLTSFFTLLALVIFSIINGNQEALTIAILMCAVIPPFIVDNLCIGRHENKRIFMGDTGSMFLGLAIAWLLIVLSQGEQRAFSPVIALWLFSIPLIDTATTVIRRVLNGSSPFKPDTSHLHHILMQLGLSSKLVVIIITLLSILMTSIGVLGEFKQVLEWKMFAGFISISFIYFIFTNYLISKTKNNS